MFSSLYVSVCIWVCVSERMCMFVTAHLYLYCLFLSILKNNHQVYWFKHLIYPLIPIIGLSMLPSDSFIKLLPLIPSRVRARWDTRIYMYSITCSSAVTWHCNTVVIEANRTQPHAYTNTNNLSLPAWLVQSFTNLPVINLSPALSIPPGRGVAVIQKQTAKGNGFLNWKERLARVCPSLACGYVRLARY